MRFRNRKIPFLHFLVALILFGGDACGGFEILAEEGGVGEVQLVAHFHYRHIAALEERLRIEYHIAAYPLRGETSAYLVDETGEVFGGDKQSVGIILQTALCGVVLVYE